MSKSISKKRATKSEIEKYNEAVGKFIQPNISLECVETYLASQMSNVSIRLETLAYKYLTGKITMKYLEAKVAECLAVISHLLNENVKLELLSLIENGQIEVLKFAGVLKDVPKN